MILPGSDDGGDVVNAEQSGANPVVDIVGVIGDVVGDSGHLRLEARKTPQVQVLPARKVEDRLRHAPLAVAVDRPAGTIGERAVVFDQPLQRLPGEIEPIEGWVVALQRRDDAQRLGVVIEAAERREAFVERPLASVAERRMAEVVRQRKRLGQILVEAERTGECTGDLRHFQGMRQPGAKMIALVGDEHLGLMLEPAERGGMDDAVAIAAEGRAAFALRLRVKPPAA